MGRGQVQQELRQAARNPSWTRSQGCRTRGGLTGPSPPLLGCGRRVGMSRLRHAGSSHGRCAPGEESKGTEQTGWTPDVLGWDVAYPKPVYFCRRTVPRHCVPRSTGCEIGRSLFTIYYLLGKQQRSHDAKPRAAAAEAFGRACRATGAIEHSSSRTASVASDAARTMAQRARGKLR